MSAAAPFTAPPAEREPRNWRTEHALMQATIDTQRELARTTARIAPAPTGSREIPAWPLAVLFVLTIAALAVFAPGAQAAPINCQGDQETFWQLSDQGRRQEYRDVCGYVYDMPALSLQLPPIIPKPPVIEPPTIPAVPKPASWAMLAAGLAVIGAVAARRRRSRSRNRDGQPA